MKIKIIKEKRKKERKKNSIEPQSSLLEAEVYNNNYKNKNKNKWLTRKKKKKLNRLIRFHSVNKIDNSNKEGKDERKKKNVQNKSKHKHNKCFTWVTIARILSFSENHNPLNLPRMSSNSVLASGLVVGEIQILIWSSTSVFLPPMSTTIRTRALYFVGALSVLLYIP